MTTPTHVVNYLGRIKIPIIVTEKKDNKGIITYDFQFARQSENVVFGDMKPQIIRYRGVMRMRIPNIMDSSKYDEYIVNPIVDT